MPIPIALGLAAAQGIYQGIKGLRQKRQAKKLKESTYIPEELLMNRDLAQQQAYSRRAPGQGQAEENNRRAMANRIANAQKSFGGDANKMAAITSAATAQNIDANAKTQAMGQQFSENAFGRLSNANMGIAEQKRQNRSEYVQTKNALQASGDQNIFSGIGNIASAGLAGIESGAFDGIGSETRGIAKALGGKLGKAVKSGARKALAKTQRGGWNDYLMMNRSGYPYDRGGYPIGYGNNQNVNRVD